MLVTRALLALGATGVLVVVPGVAAAAEAGAPADKVAICHANAADNKPYVLNTPAKDGDVSGHAEHTGPVWNPTLKAEHDWWGDIIPPFDYVEDGVTLHFDGLNWDANGQAWFANACRVPITATLDKTNDADGDGEFSDDETSAEVGAPVSFSVTVTNTSIVPAVVLGLTDTVAGATVAFTPVPDPVGTSLAPGASTTFVFTVADYTPADGAAKVNTFTALLASADDATNSGNGSDTSTVRTDLLDEGGTTGETTGGTTGGTTTGGTTGGDGGGGGETTGGDGGGVAGGDVELTPEQPFTGGGGGVTLPQTGADLWSLFALALLLISGGSWVALAPSPVRR